jgi:uridine kinase
VTSDRRVILLAGASGSGKSRVAKLSGRPRLALDDFYYDGDHPALPHTLGIVDWDDLASWDADGALAAIVGLCTTGAAEVPTYDISASTRTGVHTLDLGDAPLFLAEGVFAPDIVAACRAARVDVEALYLDRHRNVTLLFRFVRDLSERRKPPWILIRRGWARWKAEPEIRRHALALGCRPVSMAEALAIARSNPPRPGS